MNMWKKIPNKLYESVVLIENNVEFIYSFRNVFTLYITIWLERSFYGCIHIPNKVIVFSAQRGFKSTRQIFKKKQIFLTIFKYQYLIIAREKFHISLSFNQRKLKLIRDQSAVGS